MSNFSLTLRQLRKSAKMTQPELANKLGISRSTVSMYELGQREPDFETLEAVADIFNVDMNTLIGTDVNAMTFDAFTYAMQNETKDLTDMDKQILLSMAKQLNDARKKKNGETG